MLTVNVVVHITPYLAVSIRIVASFLHLNVIVATIHRRRQYTKDSSKPLPWHSRSWHGQRIEDATELASTGVAMVSHQLDPVASGKLNSAQLRTDPTHPPNFAAHARNI